MAELVDRNKLSNDFQNFLNVAEQEGWVVRLSGCKNKICVELYKNSPAGQDFGIHLDLDKDADYSEISRSIYDYYEDFDVSYETYLWLDETGHGKNDAPYDMKVLYEDMEVCEQMIYDLYNAY